MLTNSHKFGLAITTLRQLKHYQVNFKNDRAWTIDHALYEIITSHAGVELNLDHRRCKPKTVDNESFEKFERVLFQEHTVIYKTKEPWFLGMQWFQMDMNKDPLWVLFNTQTKFALWYFGEFNRPDKPKRGMHSFYINNQHCAPGYFGKNGVARIIGHGGYIENPVMFEKPMPQKTDLTDNEIVLPAHHLLEIPEFLELSQRVIRYMQTQWRMEV